MGKKVCIFEYSEEEWQEFCRKHKAEWKAFGEKIKKIRIQLRLSKKRLAKEAGIVSVRRKQPLRVRQK